MPVRPLVPVLALCALAFAAAGCAGCDARPVGDLVGAVRIDGSSTVFPLTEAVAEEFMRDNPGARVTVGVSGTGGGFAKFVRGETDLSNASRAISPAEMAQAEAAGIRFVEIPVAYDGLALITNVRSDWVDCLTVPELRRIWEPGSTVRSWADVRAGFPDVPLRLYGPGTDSGTYDYFTRAVVGEEGASRADFTSSEDDNVLVIGVEGERGSLGYFGLSYYNENRERLKLLGVDGGTGCVQPTAETVRSGAYDPLARVEFVYLNAASLANPVVAAFVDYYLEYADELAGEVGMVPLSTNGYALARRRFEARTTGSAFQDTDGRRVDDVLGAEAPPGLVPAAVPLAPGRR